MTTEKNLLVNESSLYLQQHADNPVAWYAWNPASLAAAKNENKPILLSIGYSACHWCHVMAEESFADPETAKVMNENFINIKVDREERPDLDKIYQTAHQILTGRVGGWPLTVFLNPKDLSPFFAGTYFPPRAGFGRPSFKDLLKKIAAYYHENPKAVAELNERLTEALKQLVESRKTTTNELTALPLLQSRRELGAEYDPYNAGFGDTPKFPQPTNIERLLRFWMSSKKQGHEDKIALAMAQTTLERMAKGGIYDQIGGGFFRYSVDAAWRIPHFEKMLYDNGQLLSLYAQAAAIDHNPLFLQIADETAAWVLREMQTKEGGFYATLDADSEHHEGKFYYWDRTQLAEILTPDEYQIVLSYYGIDKPPNFEGHWHLAVADDNPRLAKKIPAIKQKLLKVREQRVRPGRDEKILTAWNGLMIKGLALAGLHLGNEKYIAAAEKTLDFIGKNLWLKDRLYANYQAGRARLPAYLDDYVFLLDGLITFLQVKWRSDYLVFAKQLADQLLQYFADKEQGGFFFTASDHETLIQRPKPLMDEAIPAGNGVAASVLLRLGHLLGDKNYLQAAEGTLRMAFTTLTAYPAGHASLLNALDEYLIPPQFIVLRGSEKDLSKWLEVCQKDYHPNRLVFAIPDSETKLPGLLAEQKAIKNKVVAYVCRGTECLAPIDSLAKFEETLCQFES